MYFINDTENNLIRIWTERQDPVSEVTATDTNGQKLLLSILKTEQSEGGLYLLVDASPLETWSPAHPVLYTLQVGADSCRFGFSSLKREGREKILLNGKPVYLRGYIRGITAHEHPNMTGGSSKEADVKNIRQAKKYGFNLVRFHSTVPTPEFVETADEEGMFIHLEVDFSYDFDANGDMVVTAIDEAKWRDTILRYRNHPSIAIFCIGNEIQRAAHVPLVRRLCEEGRRMAPGKLILDNAGWGEFDRTSSDIFAQHIAYFFPYKHHAGMFTCETPWLKDGSAADVPLDVPVEGTFCGTVHRNAVPVRPVISHEACHYIELPDYEALNRKFDDFCARVGEQYLQENGIKKPRYMTELPELIRRKGLEKKVPDYMAASRQFKMFALKTFLEKCRISGLCGFEMLQFSDCLKYENKNGIVDCFDDDKYIPAEWMRQFNDDAVLLADLEDVTFFYGDEVKGSIYLSNFLESPEISNGELTLQLVRDDGVTQLLYTGKNFVVLGGLQKLITFSCRALEEDAAHSYTLSAEFRFDSRTVQNQWTIWLYPHREVALGNAVVKDRLSDDLFADLEAGKTVYLFYRRDNQENRYYWPCSMERFKPCIWDRGSNLGGILYSESLQKALASGRCFSANMQPLLEAGYKICLDDFPVPVNELICGVDKPVRDRMKGLTQGVKKFIDRDTLRNFCHLFSVNVGKGLLVVCTLRTDDVANPVTVNFLNWLFHAEDALKTDRSISPEQLKEYLTNQTQAGFRKEDVMNHFWELDDRIVEDRLYWEEVARYNGSSDKG